MARKRRKKTARKQKEPVEPLFQLDPATKRTISGIVQVSCAILLFLAINNQAGALGATVHRILTFFFGSWGFLFPYFLLASGLLHLFGAGKLELKRSMGLVVCLLSFLGLMHIGAPLEDIGPRRDELAGAVGFMVSLPFLLFMSREVGYTVLSTTFLIGLFLAFEPDIAAIITMLKPVKPVRMSRRQPAAAEAIEDIDLEEEEEEPEEADLIEDPGDDAELNIVRPNFAQTVAKNKAEKILKDKLKKRADVLEMKDTRFEEWTFPGMDLLDDQQSIVTVNDADLKKNAKRIEEKLGEFGIEVKVRDARPGPAVTQFTLQPAEGVKLSSIANLKDDLALALAAQSLRIEAPIPGKSLVGIEMPNLDRTIVHLREILESTQFNDSERCIGRSGRGFSRRNAALAHCRCNRIGKIRLYERISDGASLSECASRIEIHSHRSETRRVDAV